MKVSFDTTHKEVVDALCEIDFGLSDWELGFVKWITQQVAELGEGLYSAQRNKAEEILKRFE